MSIEEWLLFVGRFTAEKGITAVIKSCLSCAFTRLLLRIVYSCHGVADGVDMTDHCKCQHLFPCQPGCLIRQVLSVSNAGQHVLIVADCLYNDSKSIYKVGDRLL